MAAATAAVPPDVRVGRGQAEQRRSDLARPDGDHVPLFHATAADSAGLVRTPTAAARPQDRSAGDVFRGTAGSVSDLLTAPLPVNCRRADRGAANDHLPDRHLHVSQPVYFAPVLALAR